MPDDNDNKSEDNESTPGDNGHKPDNDVDMSTDTPKPNTDTSDKPQASEPSLNRESQRDPAAEETLEEAQHVFDDDPEMASSELDDKPNNPSTAPPTPPPPQLPPPDNKQLPDDDLFSKLTSHPASVPGLVTDWFSRVQINGPASVAEILTLVAKMAQPQGCPPVDLVTPQMIMANNPRAALDDLSVLLSVDADGKVPIASKDISSKRVRKAYEDFWVSLSAESPHVVLFDTDCFDTLISWLEVMAVARSRALRTAASIAAYRLVDGFVQYGTQLRRQLASLQRQLATEKRRCGAAHGQVRAKGRGRGRPSTRTGELKKISEKGKDLAKKVDDLTANNREMNELADKVFDLIFILKYRDVSPEIRAISVTALGSWTMAYPDHFLEDRYIKYLGWLLSDKDPGVRRSTLEILLRMMRKRDFYQNLRLFMTTFCDRLVEMTRDRDDTVVVAAIRLLTCLAGHELVSDSNCEKICVMAVEEQQVDIRRAAGEFLCCVLNVDERKGISKKRNGRPASRGSRTSRATSKSSKKCINPNLAEIPPVERSTRLLKELLYIVAQDDNDGRSTDHAVDAVWDSMPALRCWEAFSILLRDEGKEGRRGGSAATLGNTYSSLPEESLSEHDRALVAEILLASVREASGHGDAERRSLVARGERRSPDPPGLAFSRTFLPILPHILVQFQADVRALTALVQLPMHFHTDCFEQEGRDENFHEILLKVLDIMSRHTGSTKLFSACAKTFRMLLSDDNPLRTAALESLQHGYAAAAKELATLVRADVSRAEPMTVAAAVLRVRSLSELIQPTSPVHDSIVSILRHQIEKGPLSKLSEEVTTDAARTGSALIMWTLSKIRSRLLASLEAEDACQEVARDEIEEMKDKGALIIDLVGQMCSSVSASLPTRMTCLQGFLTTLTLCRGVEKFAGKCLHPSSTANGSQETSVEAGLDFLRVQSKTESLTSAVRSCIISVIEHDQGLQDHTLYAVSETRRRRERLVISEAAIRNCFASVIQASCQSVLSGKISHLPVLGLLLKRKKSTSRELLTDEWTTFELCKKYCQDRPAKESQRIQDEVLAIREAAQMRSTKHRDHIERELGDLILSVKPGDLLKRRASKQILDQLIKTAREADAEGIDSEIAVKMMVAAGSSFVRYVSPGDAKTLLESLDLVRSSLQEETAPSNSSTFSSLELFSDYLRAAAAGEPVEVSKLTRQIQQAKSSPVSNTPRKRKRPSDANAYRSSSRPKPAALRRSGRHRTQINYARLSCDSEDSDHESEGSVDGQEDDDEEDHSMETNDRITTAAEVARGIMEFASSPRCQIKSAKPLVKQLRTEPEKKIARETTNGMSVPGREAAKVGRDSSETSGLNSASNHQQQGESSAADTQDGADEQASVDHDAGDGINANLGKAGSGGTAEKRERSANVNNGNAEESNENGRISDITQQVQESKKPSRRSKRIRSKSHGSRQEGDQAASSVGKMSESIPDVRQPLDHNTSSEIQKAVIPPQGVNGTTAKTGKRNAKVTSNGKENIEDGDAKRREVPVVRRRKRQKRW